MSPAAFEPARPTVLVVGGGFAGVEAAKALAGEAVNVVLVDRHNFMTFQPLLYQVATAALTPSDIGYPIRRIFRRAPNVSVVLSEVSRIDPDRRVAIVADGEIPYDTLVLAAGASTSYFSHPEWEAVAPGLKTMADALAIRSRVLAAFERAEMEGDAAARRRRLTFVVVGGGPTGIELAGAIKELAVDTIPADFRNVDTTAARVVLLEGADRLLLGMEPASGARAAATLRKMGVDVRLNARVTAIDAGGLTVGTERLESENVFWAAGVTASPLATSLGVPLDRGGRVVVNADLTVPGHPEIYVCGDLASSTDPVTGRAVPGLCPAAMQMGRYAGRVIRARLRGAPPSSARPFRYVDKGTMATIGRARAVADVRGLRFSGLVAWLLWCFIHVFFLIGFRNRVVTMLSWAASYLFFAKGSRLITGDTPGRVVRPIVVQPPAAPGAPPGGAGS